jgi:glutamate synthase (NADPH) large chain
MRRSDKRNEQEQDRPPGDELPCPQGLYNPRYEHDACGTGFVAHVKGRASHAIVQDALTVLENLSHRGARGSEPNTGDGAGILLQIPHAFFRAETRLARFDLPSPGAYGVGMLFLPQDPVRRDACEAAFEAIVTIEGQQVLGWRDVPTNNLDLGETARMSEPAMRQVFISRSAGISDPLTFERKLYVIRRLAEKQIAPIP